MTLINREIRLQVAHNVRHLGGYRTRDGRETRPDIVRAASLHRLTESGVAGMAEHGIGTVIDLRSASERESMPTPHLAAHGVRHVFAPVFETDASPAGLANAYKDFGGFAPIYASFLETGANAYRTIFEAVATTDGRVLFHCAAGKDRTGVAAALLLDLAGVEDADIIDDYARSGALLEDSMKAYKPTPEQQARMADVPEETRKRLLASEPEDMAATLAVLRERWGSARGYMTAIGLPGEAIAQLRARLVA